LRQVTVRSATTIRIERMRPIVIVHDKPKGIAIEVAQIRNDSDSYILDSLVMQCTCKMMVIDDVMPVLWTKYHWNHVFAEKLFALLFAFITPTLAFGFDLTHPDGNLCWTQIHYGDRFKKWFTDSGHVRLLPRECASIGRAIGDSEGSFRNFAEML